MMIVNKKTSAMKVAIVINMPAPYRTPVFQQLAQHYGMENFKVIYCTKQEGNRNWILDQVGFSYAYLKENVFIWKSRFIHFNFDVYKELTLYNPDVIITTGFYPTSLFSFAYAMFNKKIHLPWTDGTLDSEKTLSLVHRIMRRIVFRFSKAFIGASLGSTKLYESYGIKSNQIFKACLFTNNFAFTELLKLTQRNYDLMFSGHFSPEKNPLFAIEVAVGVATLLNRKITLLMLGSGPLLEQAKIYAASVADSVEVIFPGFVQQDGLPDYYCSAKIFVFPSSWDPWAVVANEACAAGQAVLISPHAGAANDLVIDNENGYVIDLNLQLWVEKAANLLSNKILLEQFSKDSLLKVQAYNSEVAADGLINAIDSVQKLSMKKVVIVQYRLLHYRLSLFEQLRERCLALGIDLHIVYGQPTRRELSKNDVGFLPWADVVKNIVWEIGVRDWLWQPLPKHLHDADLIVMMQESRILSNYPLLLSRFWSKRKLAYWGHGANFQSDAPTGLLEQWKKLFIKKVDWWFAYTQMTVDILIKSGCPTNQITCLNNSIDTVAFKADLAQVSDAALASERNKLGIAVNAPVGIFCGSLYPDKKLDFLIAAIDIIYQQSPEFHCLVLGDGPSMPYMQVAAASRPWLHILGVTKGTQKALYFRMADFMLNPGLVGLHIVDAFCAGLVMATTSGAKHSPEIAYLQAGVNGIMTGDNVEDYAQAILSLIADRSLFDNYKNAALASADIYTLDNMVDQFVDGISRYLAR